MADVFISYSREDRSKAEHIASGLTAMGVDVFWDTDIPPGQTWADYIEGKLSACKAVIVLWSEHSIKSQWVREEARMGREQSKLIPVILDGAQPPFGFGEVQAADLSNWSGDYSQADWKRFAQAVNGAVRGAAATAQAQTQTQTQTAFVREPQPQAAGGWQAAAATSAGWRGHSAHAAGDQSPPIEYIKKCFRLYFDGKGRARRAEYWWWVLFTVAVWFVASIVDMSFGFNQYTGQPNSQVVSSLASLALLAPGICVTARRFHDVGLSGWLVAAFLAAYFIAGMLAGAGVAMGMASGDASMAVLGVLVMMGAGIAQVVIAVMPSKPGANQYGPNPKGT